MIDLHLLRMAPDTTKATLARRGVAPAVIDHLLALDAQARASRTEMEGLQAEANSLSGAFPSMDEATKASSRLVVKALRQKIGEIGGWLKDYEPRVHELLLSLPNLPGELTPQGEDASANMVLHEHGAPRHGEGLLDHQTLGERLGLLDLSTASATSGSRFSMLRGRLARLERALGQFMLDEATSFGYEEVSPPLLVGRDALIGTGQLPKFEDDLFSAGWLYLIPTAEVPLTNYARDDRQTGIEVAKFCALTPCFRAEAGASGRDTRGLIRQHQFYKVELVTICRPDYVESEFSFMLAAARNVLDKLELPHRVVHLCAGDLGFSAKETFDIEVWMAADRTYREISSVSWCGDFQARRMRARYRAGHGAMEFYHTLNGSALAVGRCLAAILEHYQLDDGAIEVPKALVRYMGGVEVIR